MTRSSGFALAALLCLGAASPGAADPREVKFLASSGLPADAKVEYLDEQGKSIGFDAFMALAAKGRTFSFEHEGKTGTARLDPLEPSTAPVARKGPTYKVAPGDAFPDFEFGTTAGTKLKGESLRGRPTLVNFFYAECAPCIAEIPAMNAYASKHPEVRVLAVTFDEMPTARLFVAQRKLKWLVAYEAQELVDAVGVQVYPTFALLDGEGRVLAVETSAEIGGPGKPHPLAEGELAAWVAEHSKAQ